MPGSIDAARTEQMVTSMTERMTTLTHTLSSWMHQQLHSLAELEQHVLRLLKELGASLLAGLATLAAPAAPPASIECTCGHLAAYQRQRRHEGKRIRRSEVPQRRQHRRVVERQGDKRQGDKQTSLRLLVSLFPCRRLFMNRRTRDTAPGTAPRCLLRRQGGWNERC
jgi:hypothetical protein